MGHAKNSYSVHIIYLNLVVVVYVYQSAFRLLPQQISKSHSAIPGIKGGDVSATAMPHKVGALFAAPTPRSEDLSESRVVSIVGNAYRSTHEQPSVARIHRRRKVFSFWFDNQESHSVFVDSSNLRRELDQVALLDKRACRRTNTRADDVA